LQYAAILAPRKVERSRIADVLMKNRFQLISKKPLTDYDSKDIKLTVFVDFNNWNTIMSHYEVYRVIGPEIRRPLIKFENTPFWTKLHYYTEAGFRGIMDLLFYYLGKQPYDYQK
jgi:hypothetical protein